MNSIILFIIQHRLRICARTLVVVFISQCAAGWGAQVIFQRGEVKNTQGSVLFRRPPSSARAVIVPEQLNFLDEIETSEVSWAIVQFTGSTKIRLKELSKITVVRNDKSPTSAPTPRVEFGAIYVRDLGNEGWSLVQAGKSTIRPDGTEYVVEVTEQGTRVIMLDGRAVLENEFGQVLLQSGEMGIARPGAAPVKARIEAISVIQWWLYYPAILDLGELQFSAEEEDVLSDSLKAYSEGALPDALRQFPGYPNNPILESDATRIYFAALLLSVGAVGQSEALLATISEPHSTAQALRSLVNTVRGQITDGAVIKSSASYWLAKSYEHQSRFELEQAEAAADSAIQISPTFSFAWVRAAEMQLAFGRIREGQRLLTHALKLAPHNAQAHALMGFLRTSQGQIGSALDSFDTAIRLDPALGSINRIWNIKFYFEQYFKK